MYKLLLISKYLRRKLAPLFAALAVTICTAMVIIVASVMGGFLEQMQTTARQLTPDVVIATPSLTGFEGYEDLIERLEDQPEVELATAGIESPGTMTIGPSTSPVKILAIDPDAYDKIVPFKRTLMWSSEDVLGLETFPRDLIRPEDVDLKSAGAALQLPRLYQNPALPADEQPGVVMGVETNPYQYRLADGSYAFANAAVGQTVTLALPVFGPNGQPIDVSQPRIRVVNEFKSGFAEIDAGVIYVPFDWLQTHLQMQRVEEFTEFDEVTGEGGESIMRDARCTHVYVKAADGYTDLETRDKAEAVVREFLNDRPQPVPIRVMTWEDVYGTLFGAVKNEKGMVTFLFIIISIVAIIMVATTFYMIVLEKTRDIGVLRAIGAPATGVLGMFLFYGLAIGLIGSALGVWLAWFTVTNLNNLQDALATRLATLIGSVVIALAVALSVAIGTAAANRRRDFSLGAGVLVFMGVFAALMAGTFYGFQNISLPVITGYDDQIGWRMWDPQLYMFERIPDKIDWSEVFWIWVGAVVSSVLGAVIPAVIAARLNPVEALRYE